MEEIITRLFKSTENLTEIKTSLVAMSRMALEIVSCATEITKKIDNLKLRYEEIVDKLDTDQDGHKRVMDALENSEKRMSQRIALATDKSEDKDE